jgi:hypothetical protein
LEDHPLLSNFPVSGSGRTDVDNSSSTDDPVEVADDEAIEPDLDLTWMEPSLSISLHRDKSEQSIGALTFKAFNVKLKTDNHMKPFLPLQENMLALLQKSNDIYSDIFRT